MRGVTRGLRAAKRAAMHPSLLVFLGGGLGALLRHGVNLQAMRLLGPSFPWGTFAINVAGSTAMGLCAGLITMRADGLVLQDARLFVMTGILGGFTTFSAFSLDALTMWQRGESAAACAYVIGSVVLSIAGLALGLAFVRQFT